MIDFEAWNDLENSMKKAGLPIGTISGNYKKVSDNPSKWEYLTQEQVFKDEGNNDRRAFLANKAKLIVGISEETCNEKDYLAKGKKKLADMQKEVKSRSIVCKLNNYQVNNVDQLHIFKDKNTDANKALRVRALPFVFPIIEKYGVRGMKNTIGDEEYQEIVGKADLTNKKGVKKRCAITVTVKRNLKTNRQCLTQLSVFVVDNKVIKSFATDANRINRNLSGLAKCSVLNDSHSTAYISNITANYSPVNRPITIQISDITEGNRLAKYEQLEKCLNGEKPVFVPKDDSRVLGTVNITLKDYSTERVEKALRTMAMTLGVPQKSAKGEIFLFKAQEQLTDKWSGFFSVFVRNVYDFVTDYFRLPKKTVMSKASDEVLTHKGKVLYSPETGEPIKKADWNKFVNKLEKFLNRNIKDSEKKIILESTSLSKILNRMLKYNTFEAVKNLPLASVTYHGKTFDWISDNVKNMKNAFGESLTRQEMTRIEVLQQSAGQQVTSVTEKIRGDIQQILIDGVKGHKSKGQVSQALFDKMVGDNRDYQRLADTEIQNAFNNATIQEEVYNTPKGEKTYFQRIEVIDGNTCPKCKAINGKIAVWSDKPLNDEKSKDKNADYVIWEGKDGKEWECPLSTLHPYCRGTWARYDIGLDNIDIDALVAEQSNNAKKWNNAVSAARKEYKEKGIENPDDSTKGFTERIKELYNGADSVEKSLTFSGHKLQGRTAFRGLNISIENKKGTIRRGVDTVPFELFKQKVLMKKYHGKKLVLN